MSHQKSLSHLSTHSEDFTPHRQSLLLRDLELLLSLPPRSLSSPLLSLPRPLRTRIIDHLLPPPHPGHPRVELHTCLWGADMVHDPWRHDIFGYGYGVAKEQKLHPDLLLVNRQLRGEILERYWRGCRVTLHVEFRNSVENYTNFEFTPHVYQLPLLPYITHARFYVEWNYEITSLRTRMSDQVGIAGGLVRGVERVLREMEGVEGIEVVVLFFWKRGGRHYMLSMQDLFELEDVVKREVEGRWLKILKGRGRRGRAGGGRNLEGLKGGESEEGGSSDQDSPAQDEDDDSAGVGYKLSCEDRGTDQSGGMEIFVSRDLEEAMRTRRKSRVDFYGNYGIEDPLPHPAYEVGKMI